LDDDCGYRAVAVEKMLDSDYDVDLSTVKERVDSTSDPNRYYQRIADGDGETGQATAELISQVDRETFETYKSLPVEAQENLAGLFRRGSDVEADGVAILVGEYQDADGGIKFLQNANPDLLESIVDRGVEPEVAALVDHGVPANIIEDIRNGAIVRPGARQAGQLEELDELSPTAISDLSDYTQRNTPTRSGIFTQQSDAGEYISERRILEEFGLSKNDHEVYTGVEVNFENGENVELDHVVVSKSDGEVVGIGETKSRPGSISDAESDLERDLQKLDLMGNSWSVRRIEVDRTPDGTNPNLAASDFSNDPTQSGAVKLGIFGPGNRRSATISPGSDSITVDIVPIPSEKSLRLLAYIAENYIATGSNPSIASTVSSHRGTVPVELESRRGGSNSDIHAIIGRVDARSTSHHTCVKSKCITTPALT